MVIKEKVPKQSTKPTDKRVYCKSRENMIMNDNRDVSWLYY